MFSYPVVGFHREFAGGLDRHGVLQWIALSRAGFARARARGAIDASAIREALRADEQERLPGCRSHCRGGATAEDAFCADPDRGAARFASPASRAGALGDAAYRGGEPDSQPSSGTWIDSAQRPEPCG